MRAFVQLAYLGSIMAASVASAQSLYEESSRSVVGFGTAVAVVGNDVLVAEPQFSKKAGIVYVFRKGASGEWAEVASLGASDGTIDNRFGRAMAADGNRLLLGATGQNEDAGAAYVFERDVAGNWRETAVLRPTDDSVENFGRSVAVRGDVAFVSSIGYREGAGAVWIFRRGTDGRWRQEAKLMAADGGRQEYFGSAIGLIGETAFISAPLKNASTGAVYVFERRDGAWRGGEKLPAPGVDAGSQFGAAVTTDADQVLVGSPLAGGGAGAVHVFGRADDGAWRSLHTLRAFDGARGTQFGVAVQRGGREIWVGAPGASGFEGRVYVVTGDPVNEFVNVQKLSVPGLQRRDGFAASLSVGASIAAVAIANDDYGLGTVAIFERDERGSWTSPRTIASKVESLPAVIGGRVDCQSGVATLFTCDQIDLVSFLPVSSIGGTRGVELNDVWGWTDPTTVREYALVGRYDGTSFVDVTDPLNPLYLGNLPLHEGANGAVWRDIKVYKDHAFIVSDGAGPHGMQVFDLTQLRTVRNAPVQFRETAHYARINSAHNIVINDETGFAYSVGSSQGGETCGGGLHMIDIRDPKTPKFAGCFADARTGRRRTGYSHDAQCVVYRGPDQQYRGREICFGANETALSIADVSNKLDPVAISMAEYPNVAYAHQGWLTEDHRYFLLGDELDEGQNDFEGTRTLIWDVTDLDDPVLLKEHFGSTPATDHNMYVLGTLVYQSNYEAGLRVLDISDIANPREVAYFDTVPDGTTAEMNGSWSNYPYFRSGVIVVTSGKEGLFILKKKETLVP